MKSIVFIVPFFGKWPKWFDAFLTSCGSNPTIDWLIFTDCPIPGKKPANVKFYKADLDMIRMLASNKIGISVTLKFPRKLCDLKPAYGDIFDEYITHYDYWGFCDADIIWGDVRKFIVPNVLERFDVITALENKIAGHFTIFRNTPVCKLMYRHMDIFKSHYCEAGYKWFDENAFTHIVQELSDQGKISVGWNKQLLDSGIESAGHQDYYLDRWLYENGRLFEVDVKGEIVKEYLYLHFITWKNTMGVCSFGYSDGVDRFYISFCKITQTTSGNFEKSTNYLRRVFWGYSRYRGYMLLKRRVYKRVTRFMNRVVMK